MENIFSERLEKLMKEKNLSQSQLADALEVKKQSINNYIKGKSRPELDVLIRLSKFFECSIDYLLGESEFKSYRHMENYDEKLEKYFCNSLNLLGADKREYYLDILTRFTESFRLTEGKSYNMEDFDLSTEIIEQTEGLRILNAKAAQTTSESKPVTFSIGSGKTITVDSHSAEYVLILTNLIEKKVAKTCYTVKAFGDIGMNALKKNFPQAYMVLDLPQENAEQIAKTMSDRFLEITSDVD